jgi:hypothetical protein
VSKELATDIERFITKMTYLESERNQILEETLAFIGSIDKQLSRKEMLELAKQRALEIADRMIEDSLRSTGLLPVKEEI